MTHEEMVTRHATVEIHEIATAPTYDETTKMIKITKAIIVKKGMVSKRPSVDFQCEDADGNKYLIMITGALLSSISMMSELEAQQDTQEETQ